MSKKNKTTDTGVIRKFSTGASRDTAKDKLDFEAFLSPEVLLKYAEYMHKNRKQSDGSLREGDNWQKGFGDNHFAVCMKSLYRHFMDLWMEHRNLGSREGIDNAICGIMFNVMAYYHKVLMDRLKKEGKKK